ncbi:hypothetical protein SCLCIDRAFT_1214502 [Scleroderma citrinum Foug A]|uniref:Uncharacterized protein n=1 Tax=Scleroderma citrinum Foug A TaxID=1036808 RepID=A0A0C2ZMY8_9AGAM|nr:hypothetical protein SCLCIDRAFT_1214502 [Scleroderma citrinum Foug A]
MSFATINPWIGSQVGLKEKKMRSQKRAVQPGCSIQASIASHGYILRFIRILVLCEFYSKENLNYYATAASMVLIGVHDPS